MDPLTLESLPSELHLRILTFLDIPSLQNVRLVGRYWMVLADDPHVWQEIRSRMGSLCFEDEIIQENLRTSTFSSILSTRAKVLSRSKLPEYIKTILSQKSDEHNTKLLALWLVVRDVNEQWDIVAKRMELPIISLDDVASVEEEISLNEYFPLWLKLHKSIIKRLQRIRFKKQGFFRLTDQIYRFNNLQELFLQKNNLKRLPNEICLCQTLIVLDITENELTCLPEGFGKLTNLENLFLAENCLSTFPESMEGLQALRFLELGSNQITEFPKFICKLTNIEGIDLRNNSIKEIPEELSQCTNLGEIILYDNQLTSLPASLGSIRILRALLLDGNDISTIPQEIENLPHIKIDLGILQRMRATANKILKKIKKSEDDITSS